MILFILIPLGLAIGIISAFFGIGGGILAIPSLFLLFPGIPPQTVMGTSMGMIFVNTTINSLFYWRKGVKVFGVPLFTLIFFMILGILSGSYLVTLIPPPYVKKIFGLLLIWAIIKTLLQKQDDKDDDSFLRQDPLKQRFHLHFLLKYAAIGLFSGIIAGLTGLGGGLVLVPFLISVLKIPLKKVPAYSSTIIACSVWGGVLFHCLHQGPSFPLPLPFLKIGQVHFGLIALITMGSFFGAQIGIKLNSKFPSSKLKWPFIALLGFFALRIFLQTS